MLHLLKASIVMLFIYCTNIGAAQNIRIRKTRNSTPTKSTSSSDGEKSLAEIIQFYGASLKTLESNLMLRLATIEEKIDALESKFVKGQCQNKAADDTHEKDQIHVNVEAINVEMIYQIVDAIDKRVQQNYRTLMTIKEHLQASNLFSNISALQQQEQQQQRRQHSRLISDMLSVVRIKLQDEANGKNENTTSLPVLDRETVKKNNSSLPFSKDDDDEKHANQAANKKFKGGIIFPSVKNKPSKINTTFATDAVSFKDVKGFSCSELLNAGMRQSGVYFLQIRGTTYWFLQVFCEQEIGDGGWTVIQRRDDFGEPRENFNRDWADYKNGFGDPAKEFWMGNENIYMLTNNEDYALRIELEDFEGNKRYAQYSHFKIHSEADYYKLEIDGYEGNAGDSLNDPWYGSNNSPFSTYNRDNDRSSLNCASMLKGGWWWKSCGRGLNGPSPSIDSLVKGGIIWFQWNGHDYALKRSYMMMKPISKMTA